MRCKAKNRRAEPCRMAAGESGLCFAHDPAKGRERAKARKKGGRNRQTPKAGSDAQNVQLRSVGAVQALIEGAVADTLLQENSAQRSRTIGYLAGLALKALEIGEMEERLAALECQRRLRRAT